MEQEDDVISLIIKSHVHRILIHGDCNQYKKAELCSCTSYIEDINAPVNGRVAVQVICELLPFE